MSKVSKRYLVLGANGFIGSHVVDRLALTGNSVFAYDRFSSGSTRFVAKNNVELVKADISDEMSLGNAMEKADFLIHCFSGTTPSSADADPYSDINKNVLTSIRIFEIAAKKNIKKIIFISSGGAVYGSRAEKGVVTEDDRPEPISPYGICKLTIEHYLNYYHRKYGLDYIIYRLTNPYGPRQQVKHNQGVIPLFIGNIMRGEPITVFGDGSMSRDYIYIEDAVEMMLKGLQAQTKHNLYNIGSGNQNSLIEIVKLLKELSKKPIEVVHKEAPKTFLEKTPISMERYEKEFGPPNTTSLAEGIRKTLESL